MADIRQKTDPPVVGELVHYIPNGGGALPAHITAANKSTRYVHLDVHQLDNTKVAVQNVPHQYADGSDVGYWEWP